MERDAMRALAKRMPRKILKLAADIVAHGLNPSELPIVVPENPTKGGSRFVVLEGNRRLVALKALENPDAFVGAIDSKTLGELRTQAAKYQESPIDAVQCVVAQDRATADHWIQLRHTGENEGAGVVTWRSDEANRYRARKGPSDASLLVLDYLQEQGVLSSDDREKIPATTLRRLLSTPAVRDKLGICFKKGSLEIRDSNDAANKALMHVVRDLISGRIKVGDVYDLESRKNYAKGLPDFTAVRASARKPSGKSASAKAISPNRSVRAVQARRMTRDRLIPLDCVLSITQDRIRSIENELRRHLSLSTHTNAVSVLFRVFVELSVDDYIEKQALAGSDGKFRTKLQVVLDDLLKHQRLTPQQAKPVRVAMQKGSYLVPSIDLLNDYIHNQHAYPAAADLRAYWDNLQPFMMAIWSV